MGCGWRGGDEAFWIHASESPMAPEPLAMAAPHPLGVDPGVAELVVHLALVGILEDLISLVGLCESSKGRERVREWHGERTRGDGEAREAKWEMGWECEQG